MDGTLHMCVSHTSEASVHMQLNAINAIKWTELCTCVYHTWMRLLCTWKLLWSDQSMMTPGKCPDVQESRSVFAGILGLEGLMQGLNTAFIHHSTHTRPCSCSIHRSQWKSWLLPAVSHTHINRVKIHCLHTANLIIHRTPGMVPQEFPADSATSPELVFHVLVAADPRTLFRQQAVFC